MDFSAFDKDFEAAETGGNKNTDLPEGKYEATLVNAEAFIAKESQVPYLKLVLRVEGHEDVSKLYKLDDPSKYKWLKGDLATCGVMITKLSQLEEMLPKAFGVKLNIQAKKNGAYTNYYINGRVGAVGAEPKPDVPF